MAHRSTGLHRILDRGAAYDLLQSLLGAVAARRRLVRDYLRPVAGARVLDIGCGPGALLTALPDDVQYVGYDLNPGYIDRARARFGDRARFYCARVGEGPEVDAGAFDLVVATGVLHHLEDSEASALVGTAARALHPGGFLVTVDPVVHPGQHPVARLLIALDRGQRVRTADGYRALLSTALVLSESWQVTDLARLPYSHFVMRARRPPSEGVAAIG